jgi:RNA polymerase sigma factor (sigma-70 family)
MPTDALVKAAGAGDVGAWAELVDRYSGLIHGIGRRYRLGDADAADVAQITWMRALEHLAGLRDPERFGGWLATVAHRESLRLLRSAAREVPTGEDLLAREADSTISLDARLLAAERRDMVRRALAKLSPGHQRLLRLLYSEPEPAYADIGRTLGMPIGSIGPTRGRALRGLRRQIESTGLADAA